MRKIPCAPLIITIGMRAENALHLLAKDYNYVLLNLLKIRPDGIYVLSISPAKDLEFEHVETLYLTEDLETYEIYYNLDGKNRIVCATIELCYDGLASYNVLVNEISWNVFE